MHHKPLIGISGPDKGGFLPWAMTYLAVRRAGGKPIRITPKSSHKISFTGLDGLILGGGSDIDPENYGEELNEISEAVEGHQLKDKVIGIILLLLRFVFSIKSSTSATDKDRDDLEKKLFLEAHKMQIPILGICRGAQMINICLGGTLYQHTSEFYVETPKMKTILPRKKIILSESSIISNLIGSSQCYVNSLHDQAIKEKGTNLEITAQDQNGIIQGIESLSGNFIVGVQWHPEYLPQLQQQQNIFKGLIAATDTAQNGLNHI